VKREYRGEIRGRKEYFARWLLFCMSTRNLPFGCGKHLNFWRKIDNQKRGMDV
jgi:hypothetical protein